MKLLLTFLVILANTSFAVEYNETAHPLGFPTPMGPVLGEITDLYNFIFWIITVIFVGVAGAMGYIMFKYREKNHPKPSKFSHHFVLEVVWTAIPAVICAVMAYFSWTAMTYIRTMPEEGLTVEVVAYQFGWNFYYPDFGGEGVYLGAPEPTKAHVQLSSAGEERFVKELVVPAGMPIKIQVTAQDVIHAFYVPELGVKIDTIPGRINYAWFQADKPGEYIGQCAELCGSAHGEMFFVVKALPYPEFVGYINLLREENGMETMSADAIREQLLGHAKPA